MNSTHRGPLGQNYPKINLRINSKCQNRQRGEGYEIEKFADIIYERLQSKCYHFRGKIRDGTLARDMYPTRNTLLVRLRIETFPVQLPQEFPPIEERRLRDLRLGSRIIASSYRWTHAHIQPSQG